jgi:hypothetical protein
MEKLLKEFRKLSIEESKKFFKSLTKMRTLLLIQLVVSRWNLLERNCIITVRRPILDY